MSIYDKSSLVLIPSGTKTGKVYSQKPVSGDGDFTFTRSSAATRVNADGNIEKETQNFLTYSNDFSNGTWAKSNLSVASSNGAWEVTDNTTSGSHYIFWGGTTPASSVVTLSIEAKAGSEDYLAMRLGGFTYAFFNVANGTLGTINAQFIDAKIEATSDGFYKCSATINTPSSGNATAFYPTDNSSSVSYTGTGAVAITIKNAQLEQGLVARDYIETTTTAVEGGITDNVPRLDYTDSSCPALLLEPQRTNVLQNSEYFSGSDWINNGVTITNNAVISPEGKTNAALLTGVSGGFGIVKFSTWTATNKVASCFAKAGSGNIFKIANVSAANRYVLFDLSDGTISEESASWTGSIEDFGNGWYRCTAISNNETGTFSLGTTAASDSVYIYGAQLEAASYATSYIPTYGSSVTFVKDDCTLSDVSNVIADSKGSFYIEGNLSTSDTSGVIVLTAGANTQDLFFIFITTAGVLLCEWFDGGTSQARLQTPAGSISVGDSFKIAVAYQDNDFVAYWNGTQIGTDSSGIAPTPTLLRIGKYNVDNYTGGSYTNAMVFPTRLTNAELAALTTI